jgi:hypothetical protein
MQMSSRIDVSETAPPGLDDGMTPSLTAEGENPPDLGDPGVEGREGAVLSNPGHPASAAPRYRRSLFRR